MAYVIPQAFAIMAIDPGGTTGVATGLFNSKRARTTEELLQRAVRKKALEVSQVEGDPQTQAWVLAQMYFDFRFKANVEMGVSLRHIHLVLEAFHLRQRSAELSPVEVSSGLLTLLLGGEVRVDEGTSIRFSAMGDCPLHRQQPSTAMTYATNARLKKWGVWTVGAEHGRDATRHLALRASKILG